MTEPFIVMAVVFVGFAVLAVVQYRKHAAGEKERTEQKHTPGQRGLFAALTAAVIVAPASLIVYLISWDDHLPVKPPVTRIGGGCAGSSGSWDLNLFPLSTVVLVLGIYGLLRLAPSVVAFFRARYRAKKGKDGTVPDGRMLLYVTAAVAALIVVTAGVRLLMGGVRPEAFTVYGALTPDNAKGFRVKSVIRRHVGSLDRVKPLAKGPPLEHDVGHHEGSHHCTMPTPSFSYAQPGVKAWIEDRPVLITRDESNRPVVRSVTTRDVNQIPHERRPHFKSWPGWAPSKNTRGPPMPYPYRIVIVERRPDGTIFAVQASGSRKYLSQDSVKVREVGLLVKPPFLPLVFVLLLCGAAFGLTFWARRPGRKQGITLWAGSLRAAAAWILVETSVLAYGIYRIYF